MDDIRFYCGRYYFNNQELKKSNIIVIIFWSLIILVQFVETQQNPKIMGTLKNRVVTDTWNSISFLLRQP